MGVYSGQASRMSFPAVSKKSVLVAIGNTKVNQFPFFLAKPTTSKSTTKISGFENVNWLTSSLPIPEAAPSLLFLLL
tara:strand:+ start:746 stop:976 length:231 start_codon:yes stop_codon:yes gene_type:complete